jgi:hypothetical protein
VIRPGLSESMKNQTVSCLPSQFDVNERGAFAEKPKQPHNPST